jgi:hypothetical protein
MLAIDTVPTTQAKKNKKGRGGGDDEPETESYTIDRFDTNAGLKVRVSETPSPFNARTMHQRRLPCFGALRSPSMRVCGCPLRKR